ncbi:helix-turn-helix domain-containing protein [Neobacillus pocheonensis]|uniref:Helix-turn-helix domain-containing protein n=1 Tax=Neobacillus pocheonensis TaxID=363869 RepID=A0ABT0WEA4_9BACI|nr:helix-turn-helix domain-containing protein [Neobacillus pocheonensis]
MLNPRMTAILRELMKAETPVTSEYLAKVLAVTSRTARNDIKELEAIVEDFGASIKSIRGTGYQLEFHQDQIFRQFLQGIMNHEKEKYDEVPTLPEDRVHYIFKRLLLAEGYCKLDDIADELFISRSTLQNDLKDVKHIFRRYGIILDKRPNFGLKVNGDEFKLRLCMADHLFQKIESAIYLTSADIIIFDLGYHAAKSIIQKLQTGDTSPRSIIAHHFVERLSCKSIKQD